MASLRNSVVTVVCFSVRGIDDQFARAILTEFLLGISLPVRIAANGPNSRTKRNASRKALPSPGNIALLHRETEDDHNDPEKNGLEREGLGLGRTDQCHRSAADKIPEPSTKIRA